MSRNLNVGLIGLGRLGRLYAKFLSRRVAGVKLVAVADTDIVRLKEVTAEFDVPLSFGNTDDLLADSAVDAVVITTPTHTHRELVIAALDHKKPTFCEKPPALSLAECSQMEQ